MKTAVRIAKSQAGFSLIELMVVVAIIGILTTIAVPNFNRFQAKAKQSEAKGNLAAIYAAEKSFYAEWSVYYGEFMDIGFQPTGRLNYHVGFQAAGNPPGVPFVEAGAGCVSTSGGCAATGFKVWNPTESATLAAAPPALTTNATCNQDANATTTPSANGFLATAGSFLQNNATGAKEDEWSIDQTNAMCNNQSGV